MRPALMIAVIVSLALGVQAVPQDARQAAEQAGAPQAQRKIPCKTPENGSMCYWTRGRLNFYQGNPAYRIWKVGTKRILGIYSGPNSQSIDVLDNEHPEFPANLARAYEADYRRNVVLNKDTPYLIGPVFAEFEVCPLEPDTPGTMQAACIESAKNIFVDFSKRGYE